MTIYEKISSFMQKTGKSYSTQSLSRQLRLNEDTTGKYLRQMLKDGQLTREWTKTKNGNSYRYRAV
jgi:response regulator of citrate/malate metabolism